MPSALIVQTDKLDSESPHGASPSENRVKVITVFPQIASIASDCGYRLALFRQRKRTWVQRYLSLLDAEFAIAVQNDLRPTNPA